MNNYDIEKACIGSAVLSQNALLELIDQTEPEDFQNEKNKIIFLSLKELYDQKSNIDIISLKDKLIQKGHFEKIGGDSELVEIFRTSPTSANIGFYIKRLIEASQKAKLNGVALELKDKSADKELSANEIIEDLEHKLKDIDREHGRSIYPVEAILGNNIANLQLKDNEYIKTGFKELDHLIYGFFEGELVILAARPGIGKSALALNIARNISATRKVLFFSLEMTVKELGLRLISAETNIDFYRLRLGILDKYELEVVQQAYQKIKKLNLHFNEQSGLKVENIVNASKRQMDYEKPAIIVVDYLGLINSTDRKAQRYIQVGDITRGLKNFAKEYKIPVLLLSQLSRSVENRQNKRPVLADLRESGDIEQDANKVIFIYRDNEEITDTELIVAKNRNGACGIVNVNFYKKYTKFV
jgi:replicative DNA helicase